MGKSNPFKKLNVLSNTLRTGDPFDGWKSEDWMMAAAIATGGMAGAGALGYGAMAGASGTTLALTGTAGLTLGMESEKIKAQKIAEEKSEVAEAKAMADARALQDRLEQEDYLMRLQSGVDTKMSKSSKTKYGSGSTTSMTAQDLLIPIVPDSAKKSQPIGLGF